MNAERRVRLGINIARSMAKCSVSVEGLSFMVWGPASNPSGWQWKPEVVRQRELTIRKWLTGDASPTFGDLARVAPALRTTTAHLMEGV